MVDDNAESLTIELLPDSRNTQTHQGYDRRLSDAVIDPELLHDDGESVVPKQESVAFASRTKRTKKTFPKWLLVRDLWEVSFLALVLLHILPIAALAAFAPRLSTYLGSLACLPDGEFILPGAASIWDRGLFFTVTVTFGRTSSWSYTHVRIIDLIWDIGVGRGGQLVLVWVAYRVFHKSLTMLMEREPISFGAYSSVAFQAGSLRSVLSILSALGSGTLTPSRKAMKLYALMALTTAYIVAMPSLFSAMTGYAAVYTPSLLMQPNDQGIQNCQDFGGCKMEPCGGPGTFSSDEGLIPGWGVVLDGWRYHCYPQSQCNETDLANDTIIHVARGRDNTGVQDYYNTYKEYYDAAAADPRCQKQTDTYTFSDCPPLNRESQLNDTGSLINITSPMLNIQRYGVNNQTGEPDFWFCNGDIIVSTESLTGGNVTGICSAVSDYQWGFSFIILIIVLVLNFTFAIVMYALWIQARRHEPINLHEGSGSDGRAAYGSVVSDEAPSLLSDVMLIAGQAERHYGDQVKGWSTSTLKERVWNGKKGLRIRADRERQLSHDGTETSSV